HSPDESASSELFLARAGAHVNRAAKGRSSSMAFAACVVEHFRVEFESLPPDWSSPMKRLAVMLIMLGCAFAQEPVKFRGAWIGQLLSDYVDCSSGHA